MFKNVDFNSEKTKDFIAGLIALFFVLTAGYLAFNRFNSSNVEQELGRGGEIITEEAAMDDPTQILENGTVAGSTTQVTYWTANDYNQGDIQTGQYTVQEGDTLWEIAEAVYGNGSMWTKVLEANSNEIGQLANGSQALIYSGQVLNIPQI